MTAAPELVRICKHPLSGDPKWYNISYPQLPTFTIHLYPKPPYRSEFQAMDQRYPNHPTSASPGATMALRIVTLKRDAFICAGPSARERKRGFTVTLASLLYWRFGQNLQRFTSFRRPAVYCNKSMPSSFVPSGPSLIRKIALFSFTTEVFQCPMCSITTTLPRDRRVAHMWEL